MESKDNNNTGFLDLLFNMLIGIFILFAISFLMINSTANKDAEIRKPKAEFLITLTWDKGYRDDVDIWVEDPLGNVIYFRNKSAGLMHLDRDDLGTYGDAIYTASGSVIEYAFNQEIVTIRGFVPGEWIINVHMYTKIGPRPITVMVRIDKLNPRVEPLMAKKIILSSYWEEQIVTRMTMTKTGKIISWSNLYKSLVTVQKTSLTSYRPRE